MSSEREQRARKALKRCQMLTPFARPDRRAFAALARDSLDGLEREARLEAEVEALREFASFVATLDDPRAIELRRSITLTELTERASAALAQQRGAE